MKYVGIKDPRGKVCLFVSKMSRLFFFGEGKFFTINFPFSAIEDDEGNIKFESNYFGEMDSEKTSRILSIIDSEGFYQYSVYDFISCVEGEDESDVWAALRWLMVFEDGYLRYDFDEINENGDFHPLHHLDVFYSSSATFKVGLMESITESIFMDILDVQTECQYLAEARLLAK